MKMIAVEASDGGGRIQGSVALEFAGRAPAVRYTVTEDGDVVLTIAGPDHDGQQMTITLEPDVLSVLVDEAVQALSDPFFRDEM